MKLREGTWSGLRHVPCPVLSETALPKDPPVCHSYHSLPEWDQVGAGHLVEHSGGPGPWPRLSLNDFFWSNFSFWFPSPFMCFLGLVDIPGISLCI